MKKIVPLCLCVVLFSSVAFGQERLNLKLDRKTLEAGKLQTFTYEYKVEGQGKKKRGVGVILIDAPPERVWEYLLKWDSMGEFVPGLDYYKTIQSLRPIAKGAVGESLIEGKLKFPMLTIKYTLDVRFDEPNLRQDWRLITPEEVDEFARKGIKTTRATGGIKNIEGFEYLEPYAGGSKTIYYYAPIVETAVPIPAFVERLLANSTLPGYVESVKKRVETNGAYRK
ncbi:MAG TPA: SRPBCC family protein [Deltaproteobacteria bacterium]|nr:SRPBCC family protein [Deltaproteobacteria bacterium]